MSRKHHGAWLEDAWEIWKDHSVRFARVRGNICEERVNPESWADDWHGELVATVVAPSAFAALRHAVEYVTRG